MRVLLVFVFVCLLAGCKKSEPAAMYPPDANRADCCEVREMVKGEVCIPEPALWFEACEDLLLHKLSYKTPDIRAYDIFIPKADPVEEIFQECNNVKPLSADKAAIYKKWFQDRILEMQSITPGMTRKQVNQILEPDGGLVCQESMSYSHKLCQTLKVEITYELATKDVERDEYFDNANDKVTGVSMPYFGFFNPE